MPHLVQIITRLNDAGPARVLRVLVEAALADGWQVTVLHGPTPADEADASTDMVEFVRAQGGRCELIDSLQPAPALRSDWRAWRELVRRLRADKADLVHSHTAKAGALGRLAALRCGVPVLHSYHGHVLRGYFRPAVSLAYRWIERGLGLHAHLHTLTPKLFRELHEEYGIGRHARWHVLPVPVAAPTMDQRTPTWNLDPDRPVIGYLGRLAAVKDVRLWLASLRELNRRRPVQGLICGTGAELPAARELVRRWSLPVCFAGQVANGTALAAMDLLLLSSRNEGQPLAAVEAASHGLPVIAPPVGGCVDLARTGILRLADRRPAALARACVQALVETSDRIRTRRRKAAAAFAPAQLVPAYLRLYRRLIS